jgi:hypothetical protein
VVQLMGSVAILMNPISISLPALVVVGLVF